MFKMRIFRSTLLGRRCIGLFVLMLLNIWFLWGTSGTAFYPKIISLLPVDPIIQGGEDVNMDVRIMRDHVRNMMQHAWGGYVKYAWGGNELRPISRKPHNESVYGSAPLGATIVDSLDTLYIMGMMDEFKMARDWVQNDMNIDKADADLSLFEINIRLVGGLLSAFALTGDNLFREKAREVAERLLPAFNASSIPNGQINLSNGRNSGGWPVLAEWGTLSLEFNYLSDVTGSGEFRSRIDKIYETINKMEEMDGLYPVNVRMRQNKTKIQSKIHWTNFDIYTFGGAADSFYEYLLKSWLQSGKTDETSLSLYLRAVNGVLNKLVYTSKQSNFTYLADIEYDRLQNRMGHLACFAGGMFALGGKELGLNKHLELGVALTATCHESYKRTSTGLGPESFVFTDDLEAEVDNDSARYYILRPEVVESYFVLWRLTHDQKYRDWGWDAVKAIEKYCRVDTGGYSGLRNVNEPSSFDDVQQSFFLAETLKYLYLLFSDDNLISLDLWVFNTEAHPLPIKDVNPFYRMQQA